MEPARRMSPHNHKHPKERYIRIPHWLMTIPRSKLDFGERWLLAHIYGFGRAGCYQSNETLAEVFGVSTRTITVWIAKLKEGGYILWVDPKGLQRTVWAKDHPDVKEAQTLIYRTNHILKSVIVMENEGLGVSKQTSRGYRSRLREGIEADFQRVAQSTAPKYRSTLLPINKRLKNKLQGNVKTKLTDKEFQDRRQQLLAGLLEAETPPQGG